MSKDTITVRERSSCQCEGPAPCSCAPYDELVFAVNGKEGFGSGDLVMDPKSGAPFVVLAMFAIWVGHVCSMGEHNP